MSTQINVTVGSGGLSDKARQLQTAARQAQLEKERTINLSAEALDKRVAAQAAKGLSPDGLPLYGPGFKQIEIERRPAANRNQNGIWKSLLTEAPFLIYNEPLKLNDFLPASATGPGPVVLGYFKAEGRTYQYLAFGVGITAFSGQSILSYQSGGAVGPYLLSTYSGTPGNTKPNLIEKVLRRVIEYDTTDLQTLAVTQAVADPLVPIRRDFNFNTFSFNAWIGSSTQQAPNGQNSRLTYRFTVNTLGVPPAPDFFIIVQASGSQYTVFSTGNSSFTLPKTFTPETTLTWVNLKVELSNNGSNISLYTKTSVEAPYELVGSQVLASPLPLGHRSLEYVQIRAQNDYQQGTVVVPPPVAIGAIQASYP